MRIFYEVINSYEIEPCESHKNVCLVEKSNTKAPPQILTITDTCPSKDLDLKHHRP